MSYEKVIGFGLNPDTPKAEPQSGRPHDSELVFFNKMGVEPIFISLKKWMPEGNREPEQKILVRGPEDFNRARQIISDARNAFLIPGQNYQDKNPLTSILMDTRTALLDQGNYSLRYRFEMDAYKKTVTQGDYNEKSGMKGGDVIGGCIDRFEREREQKPFESLEESFDNFKQQYRSNNDPAYCDRVRFNDLYVGAGYQCARNEVGIAFKLPADGVMVVFEACEDFWHDTDASMSLNKKHRGKAKYHELEFEVKQVWGELPKRIKTQDDFKEYIYRAMTVFRDHLHMNLPGSVINLKSKAEIAKENIEEKHDLTDKTLRRKRLSTSFEFAVAHGGLRTLEETMTKSLDVMHKQGRELYREKQLFNETALKPSMAFVGRGKNIIPFTNDNEPIPIVAAAPVANLR